MDTFVALLRGINVGGRIVKMAELKECFEQTNFSNVITVLQSGNVIFKSRETDQELIRKQLEFAVVNRFDYPAKIFILKQGTLKLILNKYPFVSTYDKYQNYIIFLRPGLVESLLTKADDLDPSVETVAGGNDVIYWKVQKGMSVKSSFSQVLIKSEFKDFNTIRNINTISRLTI